jgi:hypothetical protein
MHLLVAGGLSGLRRVHPMHGRTDLCIRCRESPGVRAALGTGDGAHGHGAHGHGAHGHGAGTAGPQRFGRIASIWATAVASVIGARTTDRIAPSGPTKNWVGSPYSR